MRRLPAMLLFLATASSAGADGLPAPEALYEKGEAGVPALLRYVRDDDPEVRGEALEALLRLGPRAAAAAPALRAILDDPAHPEHLRVAPVLLRIAPETPGLLPVLLAYRRAGYWECRRLESVVPEDLLEAWPDLSERLVAFLAADDPDLRRNAALFAAELPERPPSLLFALREALDRDVAEAAIGLARSGAADAAVLDALVELLRSREDDVRTAAGGALHGLGLAAAPAASGLVRVLRDGPNGEFEAAALLGTIGDDATAASALLEVVEQGPGHRVRAVAALSLAARPETAREVVPVLMEILPRPMRGRTGACGKILCDMEATDWAAEALGAYGPLAADAIPVLMETARRELFNGEVCAEALVRVGPAGIRALGDALHDDRDRVRFHAADALADAGEAAFPVAADLAVAAGDEDQLVAEAASVALRLCRPVTAERAAAWAEELAADSMPRAVARRLVAAPAVAAPTGVPFLEAAARSEDAGTRVPAELALRRLGCPAPRLAADLARRALARDDEAAHALGELGPDAAAAVPLLLAGFSGADDRATVCRAFGAIGPAAADAIPRLEEALGDPHYDVRREARAALRRIRGR